jgi:hypothetical protein
VIERDQPKAIGEGEIFQRVANIATAHFVVQLRNDWLPLTRWPFDTEPWHPHF